MGKTKEYLFVDGYNIINSWPELVGLGHSSLEQARSRLIELMANYQALKGIKVIIVFDAHLVKGSQEKKFNELGVDVVFTKTMETADNYIEKEINPLLPKNIVRVATSDRVEQQIVLGKGAARISARELRQEVISCIDGARKKYIKKPQESNLLEGRLDPKTLNILEKWRRQ